MTIWRSGNRVEARRSSLNREQQCTYHRVPHFS
ncbi:hypothetical protein FHY02_001740 [Sphingomonas sp. BK069]|nr:hypothetical protein [Sphingomonas sp. BK069]